MSISPAVGNFQQVSPLICLIWGESRSASGDGGRVSKGFGQLVVNRMEGGGGEECSFLRRMAEGEKLWEELGRSFNVSPVPLGWE